MTKKDLGVPVTITVIQTDGEATLVEWVIGEHAERVILPADVINEQMTLEDLQKGIPYGENWEERGLPLELAMIMKNRGLWTVDDVKANPTVLHAAIAEYNNQCFVKISNLIAGGK